MTDTYTLSRWSLADMYPSYDSEAMKTAFAEIENLVAEFETKRSTLTAEISPFTRWTKVFEIFSKRMRTASTSSS